MKRYLYLLAIPCAVFIMGVSGNKEQQETSAFPIGITYDEITADSNDERGYVPIQMHEPFTKVLLPAEKLVDLPDKKMGDLPGVGLSSIEQIPFEVMSAMDENETVNLANKKKNKKGFLGSGDENDITDKIKDESFEKINNGWGNGWLGEAIFSEEKRAQREADVQKKMGESEQLWRDSYISGSGRNRETGIGDDRFDRSRGGLQFDRNTSTKSSLRIEPWKIKGK
ncbi:MAG: hypothetical protein PHR77_09220 [Kiritimatiellae bacterium]|nr:hypothetical protein [Kiritimatiellia bacterium]MDD5520031.1 hypothetical protein [Kiritimatiellia bacterium]